MARHSNESTLSPMDLPMPLHISRSARLALLAALLGSAALHAGLAIAQTTPSPMWANQTTGGTPPGTTQGGATSTGMGTALPPPTSGQENQTLNPAARTVQPAFVQPPWTTNRNAGTAPQAGGVLPTWGQATPVYTPTEFELYVRQLAWPHEVRRLGAEMLSASEPVDLGEASPLVPDDYLVVPGDELAVRIWGSVDADLLLTVDRSGRINIPRVGPVLVAGVRQADLREAIKRQVARMFRSFDLSVSLSRMRGIRVYVTGFVARPGAYSVSNLSTLSAALMKAGGPSAAGSFRFIQLKRKGRPPVSFDLYEVLSSGDRDNDLVLQPDDVVHVGPIGPEVAVIGSVNQPSVVELKQGETLDTVLRLVGGFSSVADERRVTIERLDERTSNRIVELSLPDNLRASLQRGDVVRAFSRVEAKIPLGRQNKRIVIEGEVLRPGQYILPADSTIQDALAKAGGLAPNAYVFGAQFTRESVRLSQEENYDRALRDLETDLTRSASTQRTASADEVRAQEARTAATARLVERLRAVRPSGRVVLQVSPEDRTLPALSLEDGDRLYVPARPTTVGVFGSVFNASSYLHESGRTVSDFIALAGGPTRGADEDSTFVIRANGSVVSNLQGSTWFSADALARTPALPGDTVFVPEEMNKTTFTQTAKDWTQILYQLGLGAAALNAVK